MSFRALQISETVAFHPKSLRANRLAVPCAKILICHSETQHARRDSAVLEPDDGAKYDPQPAKLGSAQAITANAPKTGSPRLGSPSIVTLRRAASRDRPLEKSFHAVSWSRLTRAAG